VDFIEEEKMQLAKMQLAGSTESGWGYNKPDAELQNRDSGLNVLRRSFQGGL
jgi:hypothetical protein